MMISPYEYSELHKNDSMAELLKVRDSLIKGIWNFERTGHKEKTTINPSPYVRYSCNLDYLAYILGFINEKRPMDENEFFEMLSIDRKS